MAYSDMLVFGAWSNVQISLTCMMYGFIFLQPWNVYCIALYLWSSCWQIAVCC